MFFKKKKSCVITDSEKIFNTLNRSVVEVIEKEKLEKRMHKGECLRVKLGIDPTSPHIHIGNAVTYLKLRDFQKLGHIPVIIIGDATGIIGDTSDKDAERPMLTREQVNENKKKFIKQIGKLVDLSAVEIAYNSSWLDSLTYKEIGEQADTFSVSDFISRDNIKRRLDEGSRVSLRETLYPLMQGYDSVAIHADIELGGTDQRFNLLAGRTLQEHYNQKPQSIVMTKLIYGTDGEMMSKSRGNTINLTDTPKDMYGKVMRIPDNLTEEYLIHCTRVPIEEISETVANSPREAKARLAREIVGLYYSTKEAAYAEEEFKAVFSDGRIPKDIEKVQVSSGTKYVDIVLEAGLVSSKTEFRRLILSGGVRDMKTNKKLTVDDVVVEKNTTLKIGKRRYIKIEIV